MTAPLGFLGRQIPADSGFTITELAVVLVIVALLLGGILMPLSAQVDTANIAKTRTLLADAQEALTGFAAARGRLPCPAWDGSGTDATNTRGQESFAAGGSEANGLCQHFYGGFLPASALGLPSVDGDGFAVDAWGQRIRYSVYAGTVNGVLNPFTRLNGVATATMYNIGQSNLLNVCSSSVGITAAGCGATATTLTQSAPVVILSVGKDGTAPAGPDEQANLAANPTFVSHDPAPTFDDLVVWISPNLLFNRMIAAGRLP